MDLEIYNRIRSGGTGFFEMKRGLVAVWGKEAVQFLDGMISNDMKTLADGAQMLAAFPNAQGRLLAVIRVLRQGDRFLIETENATREKVFNNLFRFTYAGDFFVEDLSEQYRYLEMFGVIAELPSIAGSLLFNDGRSRTLAVPAEGDFEIAASVDDELAELLRIEAGVPKYSVDMDETTIVPELGLDELISYTKGCYIGQEIIARIHFRGHVAKRLTGIVSSSTELSPGAELATADGKPAGRITSLTFSPKLEQTVALAYVRYAYLAEGTELAVGDAPASVKDLPFLGSV